MQYLPEFLTILLAHGLAVVSPGPDFAIVLRQSLHYGRRTAIWTSVGIGTGLMVHITYTLLGLGFVLRNSPFGLELVKWLGAAYLAWVGIGALRSRPRSEDIATAENRKAEGERGKESGGTMSARAAWSTGFFVNVLNPKVALFFISLFPLAVSATTPKWIQAGYGAWMTLSTIGWFSFVSVVFTRESVRRAFLRHGHWIDRTLGVVFIAFAASLAFAKLR